MTEITKNIRELQARVAWIYEYQRGISQKLSKWQELETEKIALQKEIATLGHNEYSAIPSGLPIKQKQTRKFKYRESTRLNI